MMMIKAPLLGFTLIKMDKEKAASLGSLLLSVREDSLRQFIYPDINNNIPPEWQRKVKKDDDDQRALFRLQLSLPRQINQVQ
jgi:hypothetical protein